MEISLILSQCLVISFWLNSLSNANIQECHGFMTNIISWGNELGDSSNLLIIHLLLEFGFGRG